MTTYKTTEAQRLASAKYDKTRTSVRVAYTQHEGADYELLCRLAEKHGSKKAAIIKGLRLLSQELE